MASMERYTDAGLAGVTQLVECLPSKQNVEGSSPFSRSSEKPMESRKTATQCEWPLIVYCGMGTKWVRYGAVGPVAGPEPDLVFPITAKRIDRLAHHRCPISLLLRPRRMIAAAV